MSGVGAWGHRRWRLAGQIIGLADNADRPTTQFVDCGG
jgi:hypothetical protein